MPGQDVDDDRSRGDAFVQGFGTGSIHRIQAIDWDHAEDLDHLPVAVRHLAKLALHAPDRRRQVPVLEGGAIGDSPPPDKDKVLEAVANCRSYLTSWLASFAECDELDNALIESCKNDIPMMLAKVGATLSDLEGVPASEVFIFEYSGWQ